MEAEKWQGKASAEVKGITADQVWSLLADFCNIQKCMPNIDQCVRLEGEDGKPGLVRHIRHHVTTTDEKEEEEQQQQQPLLSPDEKEPVNVEKKKGGIWANEKLLTIDETARFLSYELIDNNLGMKAYEAAFRAVEVEAGEEGQVSGIEWSYVSDPIEGVKMEDFEVTRNLLLRAMVEKIQAHFSVTDPVPVVPII
ncbi:Polyketide cyclase/dehydrase and lipid transport superfamily protein [Euphorbia peplus]|nr:Polyketide cyclase/dehydrase and lipid transport superfamily protein [Euphorbia peplus]